MSNYNDTEAMLLKLNTRFEGFTPSGVIGKSTSYREVYHAVSDVGQEVALIVYDMNALPKCYGDGIVPELELIPILSQDSFPEYVASGEYEDGTSSLKWVATKFVDGTPLTDCIKVGKSFPERETLGRFYELLVAVKEISWRLKGGAHNNIHADNIIVSTDADGNEKWYLVGLNCMAEASEGKPGFDTCVPPVEYRAPETVVGRCGQTTDIFSLGVLISLVLQGKHPWDGLLSVNPDPSFYTMVKYVREEEPVLEMPTALREIISKAIAAKRSDRYKRIEEFGYDIAKYLGYEHMKGFERFGSSISTIVAAPKREEKRQEAEPEQYTQQSPPQPKANVRIEKVVGDGFKSVAGMGELKTKLTRDFIDIIKNEELAKRFQITPPNGILLFGPPGTGKTYISKRLGEEAGMLYSLIQPSDLGNIYIHGSQSMIADLFSKAEQKAKEEKCGVLLVFEEFDSLVPKRGVNDDNNQANEVAEFLARLNDCAEKGIYVVATTNRIEAIDPAITRKGRIEEVIYVGLPDEEARKELIGLELSNRPHEDMDIGHLALLTEGYTSSDIAFIIKECARCSFDESLRSDRLVKITQGLVERTIASTRASVTAEELREYERAREAYSKGKREERPRIGFRM